MRLWHEDLIPFLPRQQLLGQHRECCALRGLGWKKPHSTINYVFEYHWYVLYRFHTKVIWEIQIRGYNVDPLWEDPCYRGKNCLPYNILSGKEQIKLEKNIMYPCYKEHSNKYLTECLNNLKNKGIIIELS